MEDMLNQKWKITYIHDEKNFTCKKNKKNMPDISSILFTTNLQSIELEQSAIFCSRSYHDCK